MPNLNEDLQKITAAVQSIESDAEKLRIFIHGASDVSVSTDAGDIPTMAGIAEMAETSAQQSGGADVDLSGLVEQTSFDDFKKALGALATKDKVTAADMAAGVLPDAGKISNISIRTHGVRASMPTVQAYEIWAENYEKIRDDSNLIITVNLHGGGHHAGNVACYIAVDGVKVFSLSYLYSTWATMTTQIHGLAKFENLTKGVKKISIGWYCQNGTAQRPFNYFNPNAGNDSRLNQTISTMRIEEVLK